ncbi:hypothetical protein PTNB73_07559 [Pyrenophora teres f. teres]|nr:hypothetical protein HRS9139_06249 [Pyrenophora teres f. teres]KAE8862005.1 hypothetical protein PTNB73_07559 [Pyrenophora teres f. teres]
MLPHLLSLPTELLHNILTPLPLHSLLSFSQTCHQARTLANTNLHTISLCIVPPSSPSFPSFSHPDKTSPLSQPQPYDICLHIPRQETYDHTTLFNFQSALVSSLLRRHGTMLQTLELSVWGWTVGMALALKDLRALRTLRVRVENVTGVYRNLSRKWIAVQRAEEKKAWEILVGSGKEHEEGKGKEVAIVDKRKRRRERGFWSERLTTLEFENCDHLNLYDCQEQDPGSMQQCNDDLWRITEFIAPASARGFGQNMVIEVDPEYM